MIKCTPLTQAGELQLKVEDEHHYDLTVLSPDKQREVIANIMKIARNSKGVIVMGGHEGETKHVVSQIKSGQNRKKVFSFPEPNPVRIYYHSANFHLEEAYRQKIKFYDIPETNQTLQGEVFSLFFAEITDGITSLLRTVEGFINQLLSDEPYTIRGEVKTKRDIEYMDINTKIRDVIPVVTSIDFVSQHGSDYDNISLVNSLRDDLTHLKKDVAANYTNYQMLFKRLLDVDLVNISNSVFAFVNAVRPNYFEEEDEEEQERIRARTNSLRRIADEGTSSKDAQ